MSNHAFVKAFQPIDLLPANIISISEQGRLDRNSRVLWGVIAAMAVVTIIGYWATGLSFAWVSILAIGFCALPCVAVSIFYRRVRPDPYISFTTEVFAQLLLAMTLGAALSYPLAVTGFPYRDALLNSVDVWMGLDWRAYLKFINDRPLLAVITDLAYNSMLAQLLLLMILFVPTRRFVRLQQFVLANALGLCVALAIFIFVPAGGTYSFLRIAPHEYANLPPVMTIEQLASLDALRSGKRVLIDDLTGLITFPSFHSAWAIFYMWVFYPIKWLRVGAIQLNLLVLYSTPVQGSHYFIDLVGGAILAAFSIYVAIRLTRPASQACPAVSRAPDDVVQGNLVAQLDARD